MNDLSPAVLVVVLLLALRTDASSGTVFRNGYSVRYHLSTFGAGVNDNLCRTTLIVLGVGTAMDVSNYDMLSQSILDATDDEGEGSYLIIILDAEPGNPIKLNPQRWAQASNSLVIELINGTLLPKPDDSRLCSNFSTAVVGGHSASGSAAFYAATQDLYEFPVAGYIGLDPYYIRNTADFAAVRSKTTPVQDAAVLPLPSLYWGFSHGTCGVSVAHAASAAYRQSHPGQRVLYQLQNSGKQASCSFSHCCFTDTGCSFVCPLQCDSTSDLHHDVGLSIQLLLSALGEQKFGKSHFESTAFSLSTTEYILFLDDASEMQGVSLQDDYSAWHTVSTVA